MTETPLEITLEAQGWPPNFRYDIVQPLLQGRVSIEGVSLKVAGPTEPAGYYDKPRFKDGDFGLLDNNWGDLLPAMDAGWEIVCLPIFIKRKPVYNFLWVRADRGIDTPKDLEGRTIGTMGFTSAITVYTAGFLSRYHGVDLRKVKWLLNVPSRFELHGGKLQTEVASGPFKSPIQRLLEGEIDACTGDVTSSKLWAELESNPRVKRMFPNYQELNQRLFKEHGIYTPVHIVAMSARLNRDQPGLALKVVEAFKQSAEVALDDALGDGTSYSLIVGMRELLQKQIREWGPIFTHGVQANRETIDSYLDYNYELGLTRSRLRLDQVFPGEVIET